MNHFEYEYLTFLYGQDTALLFLSYAAIQFGVYVGIYWLRNSDNLPIRHSISVLYSLTLFTIGAKSMINLVYLDELTKEGLAVKYALIGGQLPDHIIASFAFVIFALYLLLWLSTLYLIYRHKFDEIKK